MNALVLAAGRASRFGVPKVLLPAGADETLLSRVVSTALATVEGQVVVILGREEMLARTDLEHWLERQPSDHEDRLLLVENPAFRQGLSSSLVAGLKALDVQEGVLVLLADQPALDAGRLRALVDTYREGNCLAAAAALNGKRRSPAILGPALFPELLTLSGDQGARGVLKRHAERVRLVEWGDGVWFEDVDTWETYARLARHLGWADDPTPRLPIREALPEGALEAVRAALAQDPPPYLTPSAMLISFLVEPALYRVPGILPGISALALGPAETAPDYLTLLRRATLTLLSE